MADGVIENDRSTGRFIAKPDSLTERQRAFVSAYVTNGGDQQAAAKSAGYSDPRTDGWRLRNNLAVSSAIRHAQTLAIQDGAAVAWGTMMDLLTGADVPAPVRFQAAKWTLEASGHGLAAEALKARIDNPEVKPMSEMSVAELEEHVKRMSAAVEGMKQVSGTVLEVTSDATSQG